MECSKGTYVRTLCYDIGRRARRLPGRTGAPGFRPHPEDAWSLAEIAAAVEEGTVAEKIIPPLQAPAHLPRLELDAEAAARVEHGNMIPAGREGSHLRQGGKLVAGAPPAAGWRRILKLTARGGKEFFQPVRVFPRESRRIRAKKVKR